MYLVIRAARIFAIAFASPSGDNSLAPRSIPGTASCGDRMIARFDMDRAARSISRETLFEMSLLRLRRAFRGVSLAGRGPVECSVHI